MDLGFNEIVIIIAVLAFSISVHESVHSIVAYFLGDRTSRELGRFSINPFAHVDPITTIALPLILLLAGAQPFAAAKPVPIDTARLKWDEWGMAIVAVAGPLSNLALAVLGSFLIRSGFGVSSELFSTLLVYMVTINVGLGIFNLIPFPPLDGSRVLYAIAPDWLRAIMMQIESLGFAAIAIFMFILFPLLNSNLREINTWFLRLFL